MNHSEVRFIRHTFRGPFDKMGDVLQIVVDGGCPSVLKVPIELSQIYEHNHIEYKFDRRINKIINELNVKHVIADFRTERTFETGRRISLQGNLKHVYGVPHKTDVYDYVVALPPLKECKEEKIETGMRHRQDAFNAAERLLKNLRINVKLDINNPNPSKYTGLPHWVFDIIQVIENGSGLKNLEHILTNAGWPKPKNPKLLLEQALLVDSYEISSDHPYPCITDISIQGPARFVNEMLFNNPTKGTVFAVTSVYMINPIARAFFPEIDVFSVYPLHQIIFKRHNDNIKIYEVHYETDDDGSMKTKQIKKYLGTITHSQLVEKMGENRELERVPVHVTSHIN